jgi:hypothetical protein
MKKLIALLALPFLPLSVEAGSRTYQPGYSQEQTCYEYVYREEYIPGTQSNPGRVVSSRERVEVPCSSNTYTPHPTPENIYQDDVDDNSCVEGSIVGGLLGGALGGTMATQDNWIWSIPAGVVGGSLIGCQVDGG